VQRPVFHSEADLQHAFAVVLREIHPGLQVRLEAPYPRRRAVDLLCFGPGGRTLVEFKRFTAAWSGDDPNTGELFTLKQQAADDVARRNFVFDIARLEEFCATAMVPTNGLVIMISNGASLWTEPRPGEVTRDADFRIHDGQIPTGTLQWGHLQGTEYEANRRTLTGRYPMTWQPYSVLEGRNGEFRWVAAAINPSDGPGFHRSSGWLVRGMTG
jgi:hypothetical protein